MNKPTPEPRRWIVAVTPIVECEADYVEALRLLTMIRVRVDALLALMAQAEPEEIEIKTEVIQDEHN